MKRILALILSVCIALSVVVYVPEHQVYAQTALQKAKNKKAELEQQLKASQSKLEDSKKALESATNDKERTEAAVRLEESEKEVLTAQLLELYAEGETITAAFLDAEAEYNKAEADFYEKSRLMYIYSCQSPIEILAGSQSISDFFKRINLILFVAEEDNKTIEELKSAKQEYEYKKQYQEENAEIINQMILDKDLTIDNITLSKEELEAKVGDAQVLLGEIAKQESSIEEDLEAIEAEIKKLEEAERLEEARRQEEARQEAAKESANNNQTGSNSSQSSNSGKMLWPVPASSRISSSYGNRTDPFTGITAFHSGIDIPAAKGSAILAAEGGTVVMATINGGFGKCVKIDHGNGLLTLYGHCDELLVKTGQKVKKGDLIARVGTTGRSTGNHLHFEVRVNNKNTNPMPYLQ